MSYMRDLFESNAEWRHASKAVGTNQIELWTVMKSQPAEILVTEGYLSNLQQTETQCHPAIPSRLHADQALDEGDGVLAVLAAVALVRGGVAAVTAVRVRRVAVGLDLCRARAREAGGAGVELRRHQKR